MTCLWVGARMAELGGSSEGARRSPLIRKFVVVEIIAISLGAVVGLMIFGPGVLWTIVGVGVGGAQVPGTQFTSHFNLKQGP